MTKGGVGLVVRLWVVGPVGGACAGPVKHHGVYPGQSHLTICLPSQNLSQDLLAMDMFLAP